MAFGKGGVKKQFEPAAAQLLEPGEQIVAAALAVKGTNPVVSQGLGGVVGGMIANEQLWMTVTDRRVLFVRASKVSGRPKDDATTIDARSDVVIDESKPGKLWSHLMYRRPGGEVWRLNFARPWKDEFAAIDAALAGGAAPR